MNHSALYELNDRIVTLVVSIMLTLLLILHYVNNSNPYK